MTYSLFKILMTILDRSEDPEAKKIYNFFYKTYFLSGQKTFHITNK